MLSLSLSRWISTFLFPPISLFQLPSPPAITISSRIATSAPKRPSPLECWLFANIGRAPNGDDKNKAYIGPEVDFWLIVSMCRCCCWEGGRGIGGLDRVSSRRFLRHQRTSRWVTRANTFRMQLLQPNNKSAKMLLLHSFSPLCWPSWCPREREGLNQQQSLRWRRRRRRCLCDVRGPLTSRCARVLDFPPFRLFFFLSFKIAMGCVVTRGWVEIGF